MSGIGKTLVFIALIGIGFLLKKKFSSPDQLRGIKILILNVALPATIFIALLKVEVAPHLLILPVLALFANLLLFLGGMLLLKTLGIEKKSTNYRTLLLLIPSFAPGLSCFPFLTEYLSEESLAMAAMADVGNKVFVLVILYLVAMHWYYKIALTDKSKVSTTKRVKELLLTMLKEPINFVLIFGILLLSVGLNLSALPSFLQDTIARLGTMMTPLVLIFIGLAVKLRQQNNGLLLQVLFCRAGLAFMISGLLLLILPTSIASATAILIVIFPQSACSFWPFAHMTAVQSLEGEGQQEPTFSTDLGLNLLAFSLPFSTVVILSICTIGASVAAPLPLLGLAAIFLLIGLSPTLFKRIKNWNIASDNNLITTEERLVERQSV
ncbi:MAG: permease [Saprospiraceae bacterium]